MGDYSPLDHMLMSDVCVRTVTKAHNAITELCEHYQSSVRTEVQALTDRQRELDDRMRETDALTTRVLKATKTRGEQFEAEAAPLRGGKSSSKHQS